MRDALFPFQSSQKRRAQYLLASKGIMVEVYFLFFACLRRCYSADEGMKWFFGRSDSDLEIKVHLKFSNYTTLFENYEC